MSTLVTRPPAWCHKCAHTGRFRQADLLAQACMLRTAHTPLRSAPQSAYDARALTMLSLRLQFDSILNELRTLLALGQRAAEASGTEPTTDDLSTVLNSAQARTRLHCCAASPVCIA
jgi:hypothetical protein